MIVQHIRAHSCQYGYLCNKSNKESKNGKTIRGGKVIESLNYKNTSTVYLAVGTIAMKRRIQSPVTRFAFEALFMVSLITRTRIDQTAIYYVRRVALIDTVDAVLGATTNRRVVYFNSRNALRGRFSISFVILDISALGIN